MRIGLFSGQRAYIERLISPYPHEMNPPIECPVARAIIRDLLNDLRELEQEFDRFRQPGRASEKGSEK